MTLTSTDAMTPEHLEECLTILTAGAPRTGLAHEQGPVLRSAGRLIGMSARTVQGWLRGEAPVPEDVAAWLRRRAAARRANPPPHLPETPAQQRGRTEEAKEEARELGRRLAAALKVLGWTQPSLAHAVGRSVQTANYWITGKIPPPLVVVEWAERLAADDAADPSPRAKVGSVPLTEVMEGIDLLRKAGLTKVAGLLERQMDGATAEAEAEETVPAPAPAKISVAPEKKGPPPPPAAPAAEVPMTTDEARDLIDEIGWSQRGIGKILQWKDAREPRRWFSGEEVMPPEVASWLQNIRAAKRAALASVSPGAPADVVASVVSAAVASAARDPLKVRDAVFEARQGRVRRNAEVAAEDVRAVAVSRPAPKGPLSLLERAGLAALRSGWRPRSSVAFQDAVLDSLAARGLVELGVRKAGEAREVVRLTVAGEAERKAIAQQRRKQPDQVRERERLRAERQPGWVPGVSMRTCQRVLYRLMSAVMQQRPEAISDPDVRAAARRALVRSHTEAMSVRVWAGAAGQVLAQMLAQERPRALAPTPAPVAARRAPAPADAVPGVGSARFDAAYRALMRWVAGEMAPEEIAADDPARQDAVTALRTTYVPGMTHRAWVETAVIEMEKMGYELADEDDPLADASDAGEALMTRFDEVPAEEDPGTLAGLLGEDQPAVRGGR